MNAPFAFTLTGSAGLLVVLGLCFLSVFVVVHMLFGVGRRRETERRLARTVAVARRRSGEEAPERPDVTEGGWLPPAVVGTAERLMEAGGMSTGFERRLERAGWPVRVGELVAGSVVAALLGGALGELLLGNIAVALVVAFVMGSIPSALVGMAGRKRAKRLHEQLADTLMILAGSLRSGHSLMQALDLVAKEIGDPAATEFNRVLAEIRLGRPAEQALGTMAERIGSGDLRWAVLAINIQREVGGNLSEILETVAETVRERQTILRQVQVLTSEGRMSAGILVALPFLIGLYIAVVNPGYLSPMFTTKIGLAMVVAGGVLMGLGILWMRKVVRVDV